MLDSPLMSSKILFPDAVDMVRLLNDNTIDNLLAKQPGYASVPSLYQRAYLLVHRTGVLPYDDDFRAPQKVER